MTIFNELDEVDQRSGAAPAPRTPEHYARLGRRALRRRRAVQVSATAAVVAAIVAPFALGGEDAPRAADPAASSPPSPSATASAQPTPEPGGLRIEDGALVAPGLEVTRQVEDVLATSEPSFAVEVRDGTKQTWNLVWGESPTRVTTERAGRSADTFEAWLATVTTPAGAGLALVRFGSADELVAERGRTIVEQTSEVDLPENFASPTDPTAAAEVDYGGERWYVLARQLGRSEPEYIAYPRTAEVRSLPAFLEFAQEQYAAEVGLR